MSNHLAKNISTRGNMNTSAITKGFILPFPVPDFIVRPRGLSLYGTAEDHKKIYKTEERYPKKEDDKYIVVYINWNKYVDKFGVSVYAELLKKKIEAELVDTYVDEIKIIAEPLDEVREKTKKINIELKKN